MNKCYFDILEAIKNWIQWSQKETKKESEEQRKKEKEKERALGLKVVTPEVGICNPNWPRCGFDLVSSEAPEGQNLKKNTV